MLHHFGPIGYRLLAEILWGDPKYFTKLQREVAEELIILDLLHIGLSLAWAFSHQAAIEASKDKTLLFRLDELLKLSKEAYQTNSPLRDG